MCQSSQIVVMFPHTSHRRTSPRRAQCHLPKVLTHRNSGGGTCKEHDTWNLRIYILENYTQIAKTMDYVHTHTNGSELVSTCKMSVLWFVRTSLNRELGACAPLRVNVLNSLLIFVRRASSEGRALTVLTCWIVVVLAAISSAPISVST